MHSALVHYKIKIANVVTHTHTYSPLLPPSFIFYRCALPVLFWTKRGVSAKNSAFNARWAPSTRYGVRRMRVLAGERQSNRNRVGCPDLRARCMSPSGLHTWTWTQYSILILKSTELFPSRSVLTVDRLFYVSHALYHFLVFVFF